MMQNLVEPLYSVLRDIRYTTIEAFRMYLRITNQKMLDIDPRIDSLWDKLLNWIPPGTIEQGDLSFSLTQNLLLPKLLEKLSQVSFDGLLGQPHNIFTLPANLHDVEIWDGQKRSIYSDTYGEVFKVDRYWQRIFWQLNAWQGVTQAELYNVYWELKDEAVNLVTSWRGNFEFSEPSRVPGFRGKLWKVGFSANSPEHLAGVSNVFLLRAQLLILIGGNMLLPVEFGDNMLTISLPMARVDTEVPVNPLPLVSEEEIELITKYIYAQIFPGYLAASQQLETALANEIVRLKSLVASKKIDEPWLNRWQQALEELILIRKNLAILAGSSA
jgi:hypothetical protein